MKLGPGIVTLVMETGVVLDGPVSLTFSYSAYIFTGLHVFLSTFYEVPQDGTQLFFGFLFFSFGGEGGGVQETILT